MSLNLKPKLPSKAVVEPIMTADRSILSVRNAEVPSQINGTYSYSTNSRIEFDLNSPSEFIDFANSYMRFNLSTTLNLEGSDCSAKYLAEGGAHALFREVRLETQSGTLIDRIQRYNKFYSTMSSIFHPKDFVDSHLQQAGDSVDVECKGDSQPNYKPLGGTAFTIAAGGADLTATGAADFINEVDIGDLLYFVDDDGVTISAKVSAIASATALTLALGVAGTYNSAYVVKADAGYDPARKRVANTSGSQLCCKLLLPFFQRDEYFPLFLVRSGLKVIIELERPEYVLCAPKNVISTGFSGADYSLSNVNFVAPFVQPADTLREAYISMFKQSGITMSLISYEHRLNNVSAGNVGTQNLRMNVNARSVKHLLTFVQDPRAETVRSATENAGKSTYTADCISQRLKAGITKWQVEIGSHRYPQSSPMDVQSGDNSELLAELEKTLSIYDVSTSHRWKPYEWVDVAVPYKPFEQGATNGKNSATKVIFPADFSRDSSPFSGVDATLHSINVQPEIGTAYQLTDMDGTSNPVNSELFVHSFIGLDKIVILSESGGITTLV